jgi:hypothetical protein
VTRPALQELALAEGQKLGLRQGRCGCGAGRRRPLREGGGSRKTGDGETGDEGLTQRALLK